MLIVNGNLVLNAVTVCIVVECGSESICANGYFSFILSVFKTLLCLVVMSLFLLQQAKSWMQIKQDKTVMKDFILFRFGIKSF